MKTRLILIFILLSCFSAIAQPPETNYLGNVIKAGYDLNGSYGPLNIGFTFNFYGNNYTTFYVNTNGMILFGTGSSSSVPVTIPTAALPNNYIAPFWDELVIDGTGKILCSTIGAAPNRKMVVQFTNMGFYSFPALLGTFQVILYETSNKIQIQYRELCVKNSPRTYGGTATIGLENATGTVGTLYSFQDPSAISDEQAISFTPGANYAVNPDAIYEGVYLTTNLTLPEPGISDLKSPPDNAIIGANQTFSWSGATNAASYKLKISSYSDLASATVYNTGTDLSKDISGLLLDTTYYWGVSALNATGTTWSQINKFTTTASPPLVAVPETDWVEQAKDIIIQLDYTGGDASAKTAIITSVPAQGSLYQYNGGIRGAQITAVPTTLTDTSRKVIYAATGSTGNGAGNFNFKLHDNTGDSPSALVKVNVSPPGIPNVLYVSKSTTAVEVQLDIPMADPAGKQSQFTVKVNGPAVSISSASLKTSDPNTIVLTLAAPLTGSETVYVSYTPGDITGASGGFLLGFSDILITLKSQIITFAQSLSKKYSDPPFALTATASSGLALTYSSSNLAVATISGSTLTIHAVGTSDITARQAGNTTWAPAIYVRTLTVGKGDQTITFNALPTRTFGGADFSLSATSSSGLPVSYISKNPLIATVTGNLVHIVGAGTDTITASQAGNSNWNPAVDVPQPLTVIKAAQTITFGTLADKTYGDADFTLSATSSSGLPVSYISKNPLIATVTGNLVHIVGAGTDTITASQAGNSNWNPAVDVPQPLTVIKAAQTITFGALADKTYGDADFTLSATSTSGLPVSYISKNPLIATVTGNLVHIVGAGTDTITASQAGNSNWNPAVDVPQPLTINKASLTITADDKSKEFLAPLPALTFTCTGFVNSEDQTVIDVLPLIQTTALLDSPVGAYLIDLIGGSDNNYAITPVSGTLTVTKISQTIAFTAVPDKLLVSDSFTLAATSTSGLEVSFESMDISKATVSGNILTGVKKGSVQIRAYNNGNVNYQEAETLATVEITSTHKDIMYLFTPNGDGFNDYWELPKLQEWGKCEVKVYSRWGSLVYSNPDYNNLWDGTLNGNPLPEGAYYFIIKTENEGTIKGTVNIVR